MESVSVGLWSILPPLVAIVLALLTKEVIFSLACGIFSGAVIYAVAANLGVAGVFSSVSDLMIEKMGGNAALLLFVVLLGALVAVITKAGGSAAYGSWAAGKLRSGTSAQLATGFLGCLIFIDDYFNCFTVGTVMRPVTDKHKVSREKLAYLIDATAAPVCIIAPISSWAASVISYYPTDGTMTGMQAFLRAIPMNLYAILSIVMVFWLCIRKKGDFGPMAAAQRRAEEQGLQNLMERGEQPSSKGRVLDLVIPIAALIVFSIFSMLYYGGYWNGEGLSLFDAFGATDAGTALAMASLLSLIVAFLLFVPRRLLSFREFFQGIVSGIQTMVPACVILTLAWTISGVCRDLLADRRLCGGSCGGVQYAGDADPGHYVRRVCHAFFRHRHLLGDFRHSDSHHRFRLRDSGSGIDRHCAVGDFGRFGIRRPLLADFGYHHHVLHRRRMRPH